MRLMKLVMAEWSKTKSSIVGKQNQRYAIFSLIAQHNLRMEAML